MRNKWVSDAIFLIRHAEKPDGINRGILPSGVTHEKSLTVRGWQRAGALTQYFAGAKPACMSGALAAPRFLFASKSSSLRPQYTLLPLAERLEISIDLTFGRGDESRLAEAARACPGPVLISWQREFLPDLANRILGRKEVPSVWLAKRFDITWVLELDADSQSYRFRQLPQCLLSGDSGLPIG